MASFPGLLSLPAVQHRPSGRKQRKGRFSTNTFNQELLSMLISCCLIYFDIESKYTNPLHSLNVIAYEARKSCIRKNIMELLTD